MRIIRFKNNINTLIVINMSKVLKLGYNLLKIIFLAKKYIKMFLKNVDQLLKVFVNEKYLI